MKRYIKADCDPFDPDPSIRSSNALRTTDPEVLEIYALDPIDVVRKGVAYNLNTPTDILDILASDEDYNIRDVVAMHKHTSPESLLKLVQDDYEKIACSAVANDNCPAEGVQYFYDKYCPRYPNIAWMVARHPKAPAELLAELSTSTDTLIRELVAKNINTPKNVLRSLAQDQKQSIRTEAILNMHHRGLL